jgi:cell wall-associated NlpC family hydrolase
VAPADQPQSITTLLSYLQAQVGKPYQFNAEGPDAFDCSGLVTAAYRQIKISLPHQSLVQSTYGKAVDWKTEPIKAGDLVFMYSSASPGVIGHVGVAVDSKTWIQSARTGTPVRFSAMPSLEKIQAVRRIVQQ